MRARSSTHWSLPKRTASHPASPRSASSPSRSAFRRAIPIRERPAPLRRAPRASTLSEKRRGRFRAPQASASSRWDRAFSRRDRDTPGHHAHDNQDSERREQPITDRPDPVGAYEDADLALVVARHRHLTLKSALPQKRRHESEEIQPERGDTFEGVDEHRTKYHEPD